MTKGSYPIGEPHTPPARKDTSYKSFICILLIFLLICLIILLASINWGGSKEKNEFERVGEHSAHKGEHSKNGRENEARANKTHEKMKMFEETTTEGKEVKKNSKLLEKIQTTIATPQEEEVTTPTTQKTLVTNKKETNKIFLVDEVSEDKEDQFPSTTSEIVTTIPIKKELGDDSTTTEEVVLTTTNRRKNFLTEIKDSESEEPLSTTTTEEESLLSTTEREASLTTTTRISTTTIPLTYKEETNESSSVSVDEEVNVTSTRPTTLEDEFTSTTFEPVTTLPISKKLVNESTSTEQENDLTTTEQALSTTTTENTTFEPVTTLPISKKLVDESTSTEQENDLITTEQALLTTTTGNKDSLSSSKEPKVLLTTTTTSTTSTATSTTSMTTSTTSTPEIIIMESDPVTEPITPKIPLTKTLNPVCQSSLCKTASSRMLSMMNHSAEACDDFYEFACGRFYQLEEESLEYRDAKLFEVQLEEIEESSPKFVKDFKDFYMSCVNHEQSFNYQKRMRGLEELLGAVGAFQLSGSPEVDLTDLVSSLLLRQSMPLFDIGLDVDKQSSNFILQLNLPQQSFLKTSLDGWTGLSRLKNKCLQKQKSQLRGKDINLTNVYNLLYNCQADYSSYLNLIEGVLRELNVFKTLSSPDLLKEIKEIRFNIEFEVLNNLDTLPHADSILSTFVNKKYSMRKIADLQIHFPIFDWKKLFSVVSGQEIDGSTLVQVYFPDYFQHLFTNLVTVDKRKLNNAFLAIFAYDLFINTVVPKEKSTRNQFCLDLSKKLLPDVWTYFIDKGIEKPTRDYENKQVIDLFDELKKRFCKSLMDAEWIDDSTKVAVVSKCNNLNIVVFTPADGNTLTKNYESLNITEDFQLNLMTLLPTFKKVIFSTQGTLVSPQAIFSYFVDPLSSKPLTFYSSPIIAVPLGLMQKAPHGLPNYLLKTRVGFTLARQLARHFDPTGMTYNIRLKSSSKSTYYDFVHTMKNLMDYSSPRTFQQKNISFVLNGSLSINERIVDNTALRLIFDSVNFAPDENILPWISSDYSREKVFFIAAAQELCKKTTMLEFMLQVFEQRHLPAVLRIENIIGNSEEFAEKFACPDGSGMNFPAKMQFPFLTMVEEYYEEDDGLQQSI